jgi:SAM-dependent methyltransferase
MAEFDRVAAGYDAALAHALAVSGERAEYFARTRLIYLRGCLDALGMRARSVLDFGCGIGSGTALLADLLGAQEVLGVDVSLRSIELARERWPDARFLTFDDYTPGGDVDLVFCNGVFHHVPPAERQAALGVVFRALRPGGLFAFWENNPWNPGARYVMARCEFDADANMISPPAATRMLRAAGFGPLHVRFLFIFPRILRALRRFEGPVARLPIGAQYQVLSEKPPRRELA